MEATKTGETLRKADYYLYQWQIRAIKRVAENTGHPPSEVIRDLLSRALDDPGSISRQG